MSVKQIIPAVRKEKLDAFIEHRTISSVRNREENSGGARVSRVGDGVPLPRRSVAKAGRHRELCGEVLPPRSQSLNKNVEIRLAPASLTAFLAALPSMSLNPFAPFSVFFVSFASDAIVFATAGG